MGWVRYSDTGLTTISLTEGAFRKSGLSNGRKPNCLNPNVTPGIGRSLSKWQADTEWTSKSTIFEEVNFIHIIS